MNNNCENCGAPFIAESNGINCPYCGSYFTTAIKPAALYVLKVHVPLSAELRERIKNDWERQFKGTEFFNRVVVLDGRMDLIPIQ